MKKLIVLLALIVAFAFAMMPTTAQAYTPDCWGQATAVFAQMGAMGEHASQQSNPREGLYLLANRLYYEEGVLDAPTIQALAAYLVSIDPTLEVDACMD